MLLSGRVPTAYNAAARFHRRTQRQHELVNVTINTISCSASTGCARDGHHEMLRAAVSLLVKTLYRLNNPPPSRRPTPSKTRVYPRSFSYALPPSSPPSLLPSLRLRRGPEGDEEAATDVRPKRSGATARNRATAASDRAWNAFTPRAARLADPVMPARPASDAYRRPPPRPRLTAPKAQTARKGRGRRAAPPAVPLREKRVVAELQRLPPLRERLSRGRPAQGRLPWGR